MKEILVKELEHIKEELWTISDHLYENPELGDEEYESMQLLVDYLRKHHFEIETGIVDRPTAFKAEFKSKKSGPRIAYLAEYDALPGVGHGCGHNIIGTMSVGAAVILCKLVYEVVRSIVVLCT